MLVFMCYYTIAITNLQAGNQARPHELRASTPPHAAACELPVDAPPSALLGGLPVDCLLGRPRQYGDGTPRARTPRRVSPGAPVRAAHERRAARASTPCASCASRSGTRRSSPSRSLSCTSRRPYSSPRYAWSPCCVPSPSRTGNGRLAGLGCRCSSAGGRDATAARWDAPRCACSCTIPLPFLCTHRHAN